MLATSATLTHTVPCSKLLPQPKQATMHTSVAFVSVARSAAHVARELGRCESSPVRCACSSCFAVAQMAHDPGRVDGSESGDEFRLPRASRKVAA